MIQAIYVILGLFVHSISLSSAAQSEGTLCITRSISEEQQEECQDFSLEDLPNLPNPEQVVSLNITEVDETTLDPVIFKPFINLEALTIEYNNFEYLTGAFPVLGKLRSLTIARNALTSIYWKKDLVSRENRELHTNPPKKVLNALTNEAYEALLSGEYAQDILAQLQSEDVELSPEVQQLLEELAGKAGHKELQSGPEVKNAFVNLKQLKYLNLSQNKITELGSGLKHVLTSLKEVDLSGNPWNCTQNLVWIVVWQNIAKNTNKTLCGPFDPVTNETDMFRVLSLMKKLETGCPGRCSCKLDRVSKNESMVPSAGIVNCSGIGLNRLPLELPKDMILTLDMKNNSISDLRPLASSPFYQRINRLFLDYNNISSLTGLEGSNWLSNVNAVSFQGNRLSYLPTYDLEDALKDHSGAELWFGNNPWMCDCSTILNLQNFLVKHKENIKDVGAMRCSGLGDEVNFNRKVTEVALESVCLEESNGVIELMNVINVALALLTLLLVGNLCYDYYQFRKTGKIPWIVTKMP